MSSKHYLPGGFNVTTSENVLKNNISFVIYCIN